MALLTILVIIASFWIGVAIVDRLFNLSRFNLDFQAIMLVWRTMRLNDFIDALSRRIRSFWNLYAWAGVLVSSAGILFVLYYLVQSAYDIISSPATSSAGASFAIPGVTMPFWYSIIGLMILIFAHEISHGIVARFEGLKLKSVGLGILLAIPLAFVEPDEEELKNAKRSSRLKLYGAGSFANMIVGLFALLLLLFVLSPAMQKVQIEEGVMIAGVIRNTPAEKALQKGMIIQGINGETIRTLEEFSKAMEDFKPGESIILNTDRGDFEIRLMENPQKPGYGFMGINPSQHYAIKEGMWGNLISVLHGCVLWIYFLNLNIGLMNLLPVTFLLDGGKMTKEYLEMIFPERTARFATAAVGVFSIFLLIINILPGFL